MLSGYAVVLDKGTYDAISLNPENARSQRNLYKTNLKKILRHRGLFVIASCNWTEEELKQHFEDGKFLNVGLILVYNHLQIMHLSRYNISDKPYLHTVVDKMVS